MTYGINNIDSYVNQTYFDYYMNITLTPIGILTNLASIYIFTRKTLNNNTKIGNMHAILCLFNLFPLVNSMLILQLLPAWDFHMLEYTNLSCKLVSFWLRLSLDCPSLQLCIITIMLYTSVKDHSRHMWLSSNLSTICVASFSFLFMLNFPFLFYNLETSNMTASNTTRFECRASDALAIVTDLSNLFIRYFIPFVLMFIINFLILKHFHNLEINRFKVTRQSPKPKVLIFTIMIKNMLFLVFYMPWAVSIIVSFFVDSMSLVHFYDIALTLSYTINSLPFFVHVIFNQLFRDEMKKLIQLSYRRP
jgi:hypothetical protein